MVLLKEESHIYMTKNGRISMVSIAYDFSFTIADSFKAGLNSHNIEYVAKAIDKVVREVK